MFPSSYAPLYTVFFLHGYISPEPEITTQYAFGSGFDERTGQPWHI
jgi:hypothetical protein